MGGQEKGSEARTGVVQGQAVQVDRARAWRAWGCREEIHVCSTFKGVWHCYPQQWVCGRRWQC